MMRYRSNHSEGVRMPDKLRIFTTCPQSKDSPDAITYIERVLQVSKWSDQAECTGMLIYADNSIIDPWMVAQIVIQETRQLAPLVAVQPVYMHPYTVAKMVTTINYLYRRSVWLNMIAGGFRNDLIALGDPTEHDQRYARLIEYTKIIQALLTGEQVTYDGSYYQIKNLRMTPMPLTANILMSGSSPASRAAAIDLDAVAVEYPEQNPAPYEPVPARRGIRVGIIACKSAAEAWRMANQRFPPDRRGQLQHQMAIRRSDSSWQKTLGALAHDALGGEQSSPYWMWPFKNYATFCPYLVGDYETVAKEIARYLSSGYNTFILDIPRDADDLLMAHQVFRLAESMQR